MRNVRNRCRPLLRRACHAAACVFILVAVAPPSARAAPADPVTEEATSGAASSLLERLNRETQALYREVQRGVVRVQLPQPKWVSNVNVAPGRGQLLENWKNLDPEMRRRLAQAQKQAEQPKDANGPEAEALAQGNPPPPATRRAASDAERIGSKGTYIIVPTPAVQQQQQVQAPVAPVPESGEGGGGGGDSVLERPLEMDDRPDADPAFVPNNVGLLLDVEGHLLVPLCIERETVGKDGRVRLAAPNGTMTEATFVGSDLQTNLTLLKLDRPARFPGKPVAFGDAKPVDGSLVLNVSPADGSGRLGVWTGGAQEYGFVYTTDGRVAGVARYGQFLSGPACRVIARHLIDYGAVRRATLGVHITEIPRDDPLRRQLPALGARPAMLVKQVMPGSTAERGGLKDGDLLLALAGEAVSDIPSFAAAIAARDGKTKLRVMRDGEVLEIVVDLEQK